MSRQLLDGVGKTYYDLVKESRETIVSKWNEAGFCEGLTKGSPLNENMCMMFEQTANMILKENTMSDGSNGAFETVVFPIIRRVFSKLLANDIVSVQAMNMPIGKLFYFIPETSERIQGVDVDGNTTYSHTSFADKQLPACVTVNDLTGESNCAATEFMQKSLYDLFYNDGLFDQSKGEITIVTVTGTPVHFTGNTGDIVTITTSGDVQTATDGSVKELVLKIAGFNNYCKGGLIGPDGQDMHTESFLASLKVVAANDIYAPTIGGVTQKVFAAGEEIHGTLLPQKYGKGIVEFDKICDSTGNLYFKLDLKAPVAGTSVDGYVGVNPIYYGASNFIVTYASYGTLELETEMGEVSFKLDEVNVAVTERKLRATWSPELAEDVQAFQNIDAEAELTAMLSEQIASEIDREILRDLRRGAAFSKRWDYNGWRKQAVTSTNYTQKDWNQELMTVINFISASIQKTTLRGQANFVVVSSEVAALLNSLEYFHVIGDASPESLTYNMGIAKIGNLQGKYQIYVDPYSPAAEIIVGFKGSSILDTGYIYAPYIPIQLSAALDNPFVFSKVKSIRTRYAKKMVNNKYYGRIRVDGLPQIDFNEIR
jgi:hypothetical protein